MTLSLGQQTKIFSQAPGDIQATHYRLAHHASRRMQFPDLLNVRIDVSDTVDVSKSFFSDMGAWHAYGLPAKSSSYGSFIGPLIMDMDGRWLADTMARLQISEGGRAIDLGESKATLHYYPGLLQAQYQAGTLDILQQLIFVSGREARIQTKISNRSSSSRTIDLAFMGKALLANAHMEVRSNGLAVTLDDKGKLFLISYDRAPAKIIANDKSYRTIYSPQTIPAGGNITLTQSHYYYLEAREVPGSNHAATQTIPDTQVANPASASSFNLQLTANEKRWDVYLSGGVPAVYSRGKEGVILNNWKTRLAAKAIVTLITNWRSAAKDLLHDGVFPSASYQGFYGVWSWDSWKQAVALGYFIPSLAKDNIRCLFDYQDSSGMVPDCVYTDKKENNWRDTKPPLAAWAVWTFYQRTRDREFLSEMYPKLVSYHRWWYVNRDNDKNGLCEYGSTDGTRIAAAWESGMDNAVRFDSARMVPGIGHAWSLNQESVDLNAYLYAEKIYLGKIAGMLSDRTAEDVSWTREAADLKKKVEQRFYSTEKGYYYDYHTGLHKLILIDGPEGWIPLWAGIPDSVRAAHVLAVMEDTSRFNTYLPLPTLSANHPDFNPANGYWRGPVWLDQFYYGVEGLRNYGYWKQADRFVRRLFDHAEGMKDDGEIRENYHPLTGKGLNAVNFSWSAAFLLLMIKR